MDKSFDSICELINKFLSGGYAVIYAVEAGADDVNVNVNVPKSEFVNHVYSKMKQSQLIEDLEYHIQTKALRIADIREMCSLDRIGDTDALLKRRWTSIIRELRRRGKFKDIAIISGDGDGDGDGNTTTLSDSNNQNKLVACEQAISEAAMKVGSVNVTCCYLQESLDKMQFAQLASIVNAHQCSAISADTGVETRKMDSSMMLDAIVDAIEDVLGKGSGRLVIQTMKTVYKINEETVVSNPSLFQEKLQKLLGNTSKIVLNTASKKISELLLAIGVMMTISSYITFSSMMLL